MITIIISLRQRNFGFADPGNHADGLSGACAPEKAKSTMDDHCMLTFFIVFLFSSGEPQFNHRSGTGCYICFPKFIFAPRLSVSPLQPDKLAVQADFHIPYRQPLQPD